MVEQAGPVALAANRLQPLQPGLEQAGWEDQEQVLLPKSALLHLGQEGGEKKQQGLKVVVGQRLVVEVEEKRGELELLGWVLWGQMVGQQQE